MELLMVLKAVHQGRDVLLLLIVLLLGVGIEARWQLGRTGGLGTPRLQLLHLPLLLLGGVWGRLCLLLGSVCGCLGLLRHLWLLGCW